MLQTPQQARAPRPNVRSLDADDIDARALKLLDGKDDGLLTLNPWRRIRTFDVSSLAFPVGLEVKSSDVIIDALGGSRIGLLWDDASVLESPPQEVQAGAVIGFRVSAPRGRQLEVWADDGDEVGAVTIVNAAELDKRAQLREELEKKKAEDEGKKPGALDALTKPFQDLADTTRFLVIGGLVAVVVVVVVVGSKWNGALPAPGVKV